MQSLTQRLSQEFKAIAGGIDGDRLRVPELSQPIALRVCEQRGLLMCTAVMQFEYAFANTPAGECEVHLTHTGVITRTGVQARARRGNAAVVNAFLRDAVVRERLTTLDFIEFVLIQDSTGWRARTTQMGAAWVYMAFPRTSRYVPMGHGQVRALIDVFKRLDELFAGG
ncbi:MAG: DUF3156 family protein [Thermoflexales bacterium]|nr:DUF3156 family protein [Thermoflexales bacterium]MDW8351901.1 DUF3156 family protein [Anaerolineae bacterium]